MSRADSLFREAGLDLTNWDGNDLLNFLFETKQAKSMMTKGGRTVLKVVNQFCDRGHNLSVDGVYKTIDYRYNSVANTCRKCKRDRDNKRNKLKAKGKL